MGEAAGVRDIVVVAYLVTAVLVARASQTTVARERRFWLATTAILVLLGCAKQLRIEASLTNSLRNLAQSGGWYESHREVQTTFAALALLASAALALVLARWLRGCAVSVKAAATILGLLLVFLMLRLASIHAVDMWTIAEVGSIRRGWWLELLAMMLIASFATIYRDSTRSGRSASAPS